MINLCFEDNSLICRDQGLSSLKILLDTHVFADLLIKKFPQLNLKGIKKNYIRYKPNNNCIVGYELTVEQSKIWGYAKIFSHNHNKWHKYRQYSQSINNFGMGCTLFEPEQIIFFLLPHDHKLTQLSQLSPSLLSSLIAHDGEFSQYCLTTLRYKPERRYVAQIALHQKPLAIIKAYTNKIYGQARSNALAWANVDDVLSPSGFCDDHCLISFPWVKGKSMGDLVLENHLETGMIEKVARKLKQLHQQKNFSDLISASGQEEINYLASLADDLIWLCPWWERRIKAIMAQFSGVLIHNSPLFRPIHGDFNAEQVLLDFHGSHIHFIDFDRSRMADPATDLGSFIAHLIRCQLKGQLSADDGQKIINAFIAGYNCDSDTITIDKIKFYSAIALFRLAGEPFRHGEKNWSQKIDQILTYTETLLTQSTF